MAHLAQMLRRQPTDLLLAGEALAYLAIYRIALAFVPVRRILRRVTLGLRPGPADLSTPSSASLDQAIRVRWAVESVTRNSPARFVCFPQCLAGYTMLRRRGIQTTIVYGVTRAESGELLAHTWLTLGDRTVLGGEGSAAFNPIERWS